MEWLNSTRSKSIENSAQLAINQATTDDDKTIVISVLKIGNTEWRIISFSDGVFNPPQT